MESYTLITLTRIGTIEDIIKDLQIEDIVIRSLLPLSESSYKHIIDRTIQDFYYIFDKNLRDLKDKLPTNPEIFYKILATLWNIKWRNVLIMDKLYSFSFHTIDDILLGKFLLYNYKVHILLSIFRRKEKDIVKHFLEENDFDIFTPFSFFYELIYPYSNSNRYIILVKKRLLYKILFHSGILVSNFIDNIYNKVYLPRGSYKYTADIYKHRPEYKIFLLDNFFELTWKYSKAIFLDLAFYIHFLNKINSENLIEELKKFDNEENNFVHRISKDNNLEKTIIYQINKMSEIIKNFQINLI